MEIRVELTEDDHKAFYRAYGFERNWLRKSLILVLIGLSVQASMRDSHPEGHWLQFMVRLLVICAILFPLFFVIPYLSARAKLKRALEQIPTSPEEKIYKPYSTGIEVMEDQRSVFIKLDDIKKAGKAEAYIYLMLENGEYHLLPLRCFVSVDDASRFLGIVTSGDETEKGSTLKRIRFKPVYLVGLLCFIPGFGVVIAIVMIILGIIHYKDMIVIIIGVFGIAWTIAFFKYITDEATKSPEFDKALVIGSTMQLNNLVKEIEFYKLQNGTYPDSLGQLYSKDNLVSTDDPAQFGKDPKRNSQFNYHKIGDKYLLYSSGVDGTPGTSDDIYPTLTNKDTTRLGFIRKK